MFPFEFLDALFELFDMPHQRVDSACGVNVVPRVKLLLQDHKLIAVQHFVSPILATDLAHTAPMDFLALCQIMAFRFMFHHMHEKLRQLLVGCPFTQGSPEI